MSQPPYTPPPGPPGPPGYPGQPSPPPYDGYGQGPPPPAGGPPRRSSSTVVIVIAVVVASLFACGIFSALGVYGFRRYLERARAAGAPASSPVDPGAPVAGGSAAPSPGTVLPATDGLSEITLAPGWRSMPEMGGEGVVRAGNTSTDEYLLIITEPKADFAPHVDLAKYGEVVTGAMQQKMVSPALGAAVAATVGGRPALQYELSGAVDLLNLGYLVTVVEGVEHYHQILLWTTKSKLAGSRAGFQRTAATFRER